MNTTAIGAKYERAAADFLAGQGLTILMQNWRTRWCEVDIVARDQNGVIRIVEVRYRTDTGAGDALQSITPTKQRRLIRAARSWQAIHSAPHGIQIDVVAIDDGTVEFLENAVQDG